MNAKFTDQDLRDYLKGIMDPELEDTFSKALDEDQDLRDRWESFLKTQEDQIGNNLFMASSLSLEDIQAYNQGEANTKITELIENSPLGQFMAEWVHSWEEGYEGKREPISLDQILEEESSQPYSILLEEDPQEEEARLSDSHGKVNGNVWDKGDSLQLPDMGKGKVQRQGEGWKLSLVFDSFYVDEGAQFLWKKGEEILETKPLSSKEITLEITDTGTFEGEISLDGTPLNRFRFTRNECKFFGGSSAREHLKKIWDLPEAGQVKAAADSRDTSLKQGVWMMAQEDSRAEVLLRQGEEFALRFFFSHQEEENLLSGHFTMGEEAKEWEIVNGQAQVPVSQFNLPLRAVDSQGKVYTFTQLVISQ